MTTPGGGPILIPVTNTPAQICPAMGQNINILILNLDTTANLFIGSSPGITPTNTLLIAPGGSVIQNAGRTIWGFTDSTTPPINVQISADTSQYNLAPGQVLNDVNIIALSTAIALAISQAGIPLLGNPVLLYDSSSNTPGAPTLFGVNATQWTKLVGAGVTGLSTAIGYQSSDGPGVVNGIPASWPGPEQGSFPVGITNQIMNFAPDIPTTISGANNARLTTYLSGAPNNSWIMPYHECNSNGGNHNPADIQALDTFMLPFVHGVNPTLKYGRGLIAFPVYAQGQDPTPWITPGMDFYGMDGYQAMQTALTVEKVFSQLVEFILTVTPNAKIAIIETNTGLNITDWWTQVTAFAIANNLFTVQSFWGTGGLGQAWQNSFAPEMNVVSAALAATGTLPTIAPGATETFTPLLPSPVAGYADAQAISYDIQLTANAGTGSTIPFAKVIVNWFDSDSTTARVIDSQHWFIPMGTNGNSGTIINGKGPQIGQFLQIQVQNLDTVACTVDIVSNSTGREESQHDWQWDAFSSPAVPTFTLTPGNAGFSNTLGAFQGVSVPAGSNTKQFLCGMRAGQAYVRFGAATSNPFITVSIQPVPLSNFSNAVLLDEVLNGNSDFTGEVIMPRAPILVSFSNSDTVAHNVAGIITTAGP